VPRPVKPRRISFIPEDNFFIPLGKPKCRLKTVELKIEELEAMRLKDMENLSQEDCAEKMHVSRQTFQLIIDGARKKVTEALTQGKAISIKGGNYTLNICNYRCRICGQEFHEVYEKEELACPNCENDQVECVQRGPFCIKKCQKFQKD